MLWTRHTKGRSGQGPGSSAEGWASAGSALRGADNAGNRRSEGTLRAPGARLQPALTPVCYGIAG
eukprot:3603980-Rhodomonas_salina.2